MKSRFILFRRAGVFYSEDTVTRRQHSLRTKDEAEALTLLHSKNEAHRQPVLNLQIARTYLTATDPEIAKRTWQAPMEEMTRTKTGSTLVHYKRAMQDPLSPLEDRRHYSPFLALRVGRARPHLRLPGTLRPGGAGAQQQGRPSRLREEMCLSGI